MNFDAVIEAQLAGRRLQVNALLDFQFASATVRAWPGRGDLVTTGGRTYTGSQALVTIDLGAYAVDGAAEQFSVGVSGVDATFAAKVLAGEGEAIGQKLIIAFQFMDEDYQVLGDPVPIRSGRMRGFSIRNTLQTRSVSVICESIFSARGRSPLTFMSDREQQLRFPGDRGLERVPLLISKTFVWPK